MPGLEGCVGGVKRSVKMEGVLNVPTRRSWWVVMIVTVVMLTPLVLSVNCDLSRSIVLFSIGLSVLVLLRSFQCWLMRTVLHCEYHSRNGQGINEKEL